MDPLNMEITETLKSIILIIKYGKCRPRTEGKKRFVFTFS